MSIKRVLFLLANGNEDIEVITPVDILRRCEIEVQLASIHDKIVTLSNGINIVADELLGTQNPQNFNAIVIAGGIKGRDALIEKSSKVLKLLNAFNDANKIVAAICASPIVLDKAGLLKGKKFTCYPSFETQIQDGQYTQNEKVVVDGNIITSRGPATASDYGFAIAKSLGEVEKAQASQKGMLYI